MIESLNKVLVMFKLFSRESTRRDELTQLQTELFADHFGQLVFSTVADGGYVSDSDIDFCESSANARRVMALENVSTSQAPQAALL